MIEKEEGSGKRGSVCNVQIARNVFEVLLYNTGMAFEIYGTGRYDDAELI